MKISAFHKLNGDYVLLNPTEKTDFSYASVLFQKTIDPEVDLVGGPKYPHIKLDPEIDQMKPDYSLYPGIDTSYGYTYKACPRTCEFCIVPKQNNDETHYSIWDFHRSKFNKICLLNNNTLADPYWRDTFDEILDVKKLKIKDQNGFDARLITEEVGRYIKRLKFVGYIHSAWDFMDHEEEVLTGLKILRKSKSRISCYVLIGNTTHEENLHRVYRLRSIKIDPYVMPLDKTNLYQKAFQRWANAYQLKSVKWEDYKYKVDFIK